MYHTTGVLQAGFFLLAIYGLWTQLVLIKKRVKQSAMTAYTSGSATDVLSLNQMVSSYLAYYFFLAYGTAVEEFNHYLVWTRLGALILIGLIVLEIWKDRREAKSLSALILVASSFIFALWLILNSDLAIIFRTWFQIAIVILSVVLAQGYVHQYLSLRRSSNVGAVSWKMHFATLLKDISGLAFGAAMGFKDGWPITLLNGTSAVTKIFILYEIRRLRKG